MSLVLFQTTRTSLQPAWASERLIKYSTPVGLPVITVALAVEQMVEVLAQMEVLLLPILAVEEAVEVAE